MSKINVRSPYFIYDNSTNGGNALASATFELRIECTQEILLQAISDTPKYDAHTLLL